MTGREASAKALPGMQTQYAQFDGFHGEYTCSYIPNVVYAEYDKPYTLQIIRPNAPKEKVFPLLVFVQGSAWFKQNVFMNLPQMCTLASYGFVVAMVEYRAIPEHRHPAQVEDAKAAIRFMRAHAEEYGVDKKRVGVLGDSSGGHVALMTALTPGELNNGVCGKESDLVSAVVDIYGVADILTLGEYHTAFEHDSVDSPEGMLLGGVPSQLEAEAKAASPRWRVREDVEIPPIMVIHGDRDNVVHHTQSIYLVEALQAAKKDVTFIKVLGADHGPGIWSRERLQMIAEFFHARLTVVE